MDNCELCEASNALEILKAEGPYCEECKAEEQQEQEQQNSRKAFTVQTRDQREQEQRRMDYLEAQCIGKQPL